MAHFIKADGSPADVCGYGEAAYFAGFAFQHIADRDEAERLARKRADGRTVWHDGPPGAGQGGHGMTGQQQADEALRLDRERRAAVRRGDTADAERAERELGRLLD